LQSEGASDPKRWLHDMVNGLMHVVDKITVEQIDPESVRQYLLHALVFSIVPKLKVRLSDKTVKRLTKAAGSGSNIDLDTAPAEPVRKDKTIVDWSKAREMLQKELWKANATGVKLILDDLMSEGQDTYDLPDEQRPFSLFDMSADPHFDEEALDPDASGLLQLQLSRYETDHDNFGKPFKDFLLKNFGVGGVVPKVAICPAAKDLRDSVSSLAYAKMAGCNLNVEWAVGVTAEAFFKVLPHQFQDYVFVLGAASKESFWFEEGLLVGSDWAIP
jgi:hypothetical protein